jgi:hypothetical protein
VSYDYNEIRSKRQTIGTQWAAYSELFMVLAFIFLLMYMVASLRTGMISVTTHAKIEDLKQELKLYQSVKNEYLEQGQNAQQKKIYQQILGQITLLKSEASENKERLEIEFNEQKQRESSLNQYHKMIVAMIDANAIAKAEAAEKFNAEQQQKKKLE